MTNPEFKLSGAESFDKKSQQFFAEDALDVGFYGFNGSSFKLIFLLKAVQEGVRHIMKDSKLFGRVVGGKELLKQLSCDGKPRNERKNFRVLIEFRM